MTTTTTTATTTSDATKSVITCDLEGRIETFNAGAETLFGWRANEVIGKKRVSLFSPGEVVLEHVPRWLKTAVDEGSYETDTVFVTKNGAQFPAHIRISPTKKAGAHVGYCGITERLPDDKLESARPKISFSTKAFRWLVVTRAPFLTATIVPVLVGAAIAHAFASSFSWLAFALAFVGACALHVAANTWNDVFDWQSGTDEANNDYFLPFSGGSRAIELGLITWNGLRVVAWSSALVAAACGAVLALISTPWVLAFGVAGGIGAYFYTAPPLRLVARHGLGELAIVLCFGPLMIAGTYAATTGWTPNVDVDGITRAALAGIPVGLLCSAILFINEFPDAASDAKTGKNHLVVTLGKRVARFAFAFLLVAAFAVLVALVVTGVLPKLALVALVAAPFAVRAIAVCLAHYDDRGLIVANKSTIFLHTTAGLLLAIGIAASTVLP